LSLPTGEFSHATLAVFPRLDPLQRPLSCNPIIVRIPEVVSTMAKPPHEHDVQDGDGKVPIEADILGHVSHSLDHLGWPFVKNTNGPPFGLQKTQNEFHQGGLSTPVWSEECEEIILPNTQIRLFDDRNAIKRKPEVSDFHNRHGHHSPHLKAALNFSATSIRFAFQLRAKGFTKTICPPMALATVSALLVEN